MQPNPLLITRGLTLSPSFYTQALKQENQEFARVLWIKADYG